MDEPTLEDLNEILKLFLDSDVQDLHVEVAGVTMAVSRSGAGLPSVGGPRPSGAPAATAAPSAVPTAVPDAATSASEAVAADISAASAASGTSAPAREGLLDVKAPVLGVFYRRPSPDQSAFVEVGDTVAPDDTVCIVDVMKLFNHVQAGCEGRIAEILVEDGEMVEFGQALMLVEPAT